MFENSHAIHGVEWRFFSQLLLWGGEMGRNGREDKGSGETEPGLNGFAGWLGFDQD